MKTNRNLLLSCISLTLLLGVVASPALSAQTPESGSDQETQVRNIEQPLFRIGLSLGGVGLIGILISSAIDAKHATSIDRRPV